MANIPKTRHLTTKQSRLINSTTGKRENVFFWGVSCPFKKTKTNAALQMFYVDGNTFDTFVGAQGYTLRFGESRKM